jgi:hypothetical protein
LLLGAGQRLARKWESPGQGDIVPLSVSVSRSFYPLVELWTNIYQRWMIYIFLTVALVG